MDSVFGLRLNLEGMKFPDLRLEQFRLPGHVAGKDVPGTMVFSGEIPVLAGAQYNLAG